MATANTREVSGSSRYDDLKAMLDTRRRELVREVQVRIRDARTDSLLERDVLDQGESSEVDIQDAIGFALIQMKAETLDKIDAIECDFVITPHPGASQFYERLAGDASLFDDFSCSHRATFARGQLDERLAREAAGE